MILYFFITLQKKNVMKKTIILLLAALMLYVADAQQASRVPGSPYPVSQMPDTVYLVGLANISDGQLLAILTLQGMLAKVKPEIYIDMGGGYTTWMQDLSANYNIVFDNTFYSDFDGLIAHFKNKIGGYYICNVGDSSTNVAVTACGYHNDKIAITDDLVPLMDSLGIQLEYDVRNLGEHWMYDNYGNLASTMVAAYQRYDNSLFLGDYSILAGAFQFYEAIDNPLVDSVLNRLGANAVVFGWGDDEYQTVSKLSEYGVALHAADWMRNLSLLSNMEAVTTQYTHPDSVIMTDNVHTVCFLMSDGDNLNWLVNEFQAQPNWYGSSDRGCCDMGWTIAPSFSELMPTVMKYYYEHATNNAQAQDNFVAAASGTGYIFPDKYPDLQSYASLLNEYMQKADLRILNILGSSYDDSYMLPFLEQPNIDAIFYYDYANYSGLNGAIYSVNGKPVIGARYNFWDGFEDVQSLVNNLNNASTDAYSPDGYSLVVVHAWSRTMSDVKSVVEQLDSNVIVVTPEEFVERIKHKLGFVNNTNGNVAAQCTLWPNPVKETLYIHVSDNGTKVEIITPDGQIVKSLQPATNAVTQVDVSLLDPGVYFVRFSGGNTNMVKKIIKL